MSGVVAGLKSLGPKRLAALAGTGLALLALLAALAMRAGDPPMAPLFGDMEARDAAAVVASLEKQRVPYRLEAGGTRILAPADQVPRLRLTLAREGLPSGGGVGWEIFDRAESLTTTPFQQDVNRLRALEGEIARTIRGLAGVRTARVRLAPPVDSARLAAGAFEGCAIRRGTRANVPLGRVCRAWAGERRQCAPRDGPHSVCSPPWSWPCRPRRNSSPHSRKRACTPFRASPSRTGARWKTCGSAMPPGAG